LGFCLTKTMIDSCMHSFFLRRDEKKEPSCFGREAKERRQEE
jgi:hypothetical protein